MDKEKLKKRLLAEFADISRRMGKVNSKLENIYVKKYNALVSKGIIKMGPINIRERTWTSPISENIYTHKRKKCPICKGIMKLKRGSYICKKDGFKVSKKLIDRGEKLIKERVKLGKKYEKEIKEFNKEYEKGLRKTKKSKKRRKK